MIHLAPVPGELRATITVKRKATGLEETYEIIGHADPEKLKEILQKHREARLASKAAITNQPTME